MRAAYITGQLKEGAFASWFPQKFLSSLFGSDNVVSIPLEKITGINRPKDIKFLCLTGITGEKNPYLEAISKDDMKKLIHWAWQNGITLWFDCAASYSAAAKVNYASLTAQREEWGWDIFNGVAKGPHPEQIALQEKRPRYDNSGFDNNVMVDVQLTDRKLLKPSFKAASCHSPLFFPSDHPDANIGLKVIARFSGITGETKSEPIALAIKKHGSARFVFSGILPMIRAAYLDGIDHPSVSQLRDELLEAEPSHRYLWQAIFRSLGPAYKNLPGARALCYGD